MRLASRFSGQELNDNVMERLFGAGWTTGEEDRTLRNLGRILDGSDDDENLLGDKDAIALERIRIRTCIAVWKYNSMGESLSEETQRILEECAAIDPFAMNSLGRYWSRNGSTEVSHYLKKAVEVFEHASLLGNAEAMFNLGICYYKGKGVPPDKNKAIRLYERAASLGNSRAMNNLAICLSNGDGVPEDKERAIQLFELASSLGSAHAMYNLGQCHYSGEGVSRDLKKAFLLYWRASSLGHAKAMYDLGTCYEQGKGVAQNKSKAKELHNRASSLLCSCTRNMNKVDTASCHTGDGSSHMKSAISFYQHASSLGSASAMFHLGECYYNGNGVPQDYAKALELWERAAKLGFQKAEEALKTMMSTE